MSNMNAEISVRVWPNEGSWRVATAKERREYLEELGRIALRVKRAELLAGLDKNGRPLEPIRERRRDQAGGPPLCPHGESSRTVRLLDFDIDEGAAEVRLYWHEGWDEVLVHHAQGIVRKGRIEPSRDVLGISPQGREQIREQAVAWWVSRPGRDRERER